MVDKNFYFSWLVTFMLHFYVLDNKHRISPGKVPHKYVLSTSLILAENLYIGLVHKIFLRSFLYEPQKYKKIIKFCKEILLLFLFMISSYFIIRRYTKE